MKDEPLHKTPRGVFPERIVLAFPDDDRRRDAPRVIDGEVAFRIDDIKRVEPRLERVRQRHFVEGVKNPDLLPKAVGVFRAATAPPGADRRVFSLGIDDDAAAGPQAQVRDDDARALAATGARYEGDMAVVGVTERGRLIAQGFADPQAIRRAVRRYAEFMGCLAQPHPLRRAKRHRSCRSA